MMRLGKMSKKRQEKGRKLEKMHASARKSHLPLRQVKEDYIEREIRKKEIFFWEEKS